MPKLEKVCMLQQRLRAAAIKEKCKQAKELFSEFEALCGSTICRSIKGTESGKPLCSCDECVANAVKILEKMLEK